MKIALLCIGDGRDEVHERSWTSAEEHLPMEMFDEKIVIDDRDHQLGFRGAIQLGWQGVLETGADWCFWLEMDFLFERDVPLGDMLGVMYNNEHLVQMALLRQTVNAAEEESGGLLQHYCKDYEQQECWIEQKLFTTNPNLCPTWIMRGGWPQVEHSEGKFGINLFASDPALRGAFWGNGETWVEHVGERVGVGY